ncbi:hypothetical protein N7481_001096 [Penicillium waksmanii]|uniref:uncharacterized protein n=1 Tax=Penicillium waksmanii TaxID=69791 RepID=UPI002547077C|nr:uncharacterized protein N7481_001096 [Penicillium waksmanii]KAJ6000687.1 hypothetical protein N7481_001096 [Penicillium waksmanii]
MATHRRVPSASPTPDKVFLEACDVYFQHCHNKPYGFFSAKLFKLKVSQNKIPLHLRLALIACATRYSSRSQWKERKQSTIDGYARGAWELIMSSPDGLDGNEDVSLIQTLAILGVIDATAGRRRGAWVKIGMAVRISQDLNMMAEPCSQLSVLEQDERRNLFWSLYLLDRFVCCSFDRPPAIKDSDCLLNLPTNHGSSKSATPLTLRQLRSQSSHDMSHQSGMFGISIGLASVLGRAVKCMMTKTPNSHSPWQNDSEFSAIYSDLENLKELAVRNSPVLAEPGQPRSQSDMQDTDREQTAHMVLSHTVYHLAHCILSHPFLLALKLQSFQYSEIPPAWLEETRATCLVHAGSLVTVLVEAKAAGYMPVPSVYSYCILLASTIHAFYLYSDSSAISASSAEYLRTALDYLGEISELWGNAQMMANALKSFIIQCSRYSDILLCHKPRLHELTQTETTILTAVVDYWTMMDPRNPVFDLAPFNADNFPDFSDTEFGYLTPPTSSALGGDLFDWCINKEGHSIDPDILLQYPVSMMSPIPSEDSGSPRWDWDHELDSFTERK